MKKKLVFKKWVEVLLGIIVIGLVMIIASECDNILIFITTHIIAVLLLLLISRFFKYCRGYDE